ncbi:MAG: thioredoxin family protein [Candidatus Anstonellales archaeon]
MFIDDKLSKEISKQLSVLSKEVKLVMFTQEIECMYCRETRTLLEELVQTSDKLKLEVYNFIVDKEKADALGIDKIPAIAILEGDKDFGIRYYGIPSGYEFASLLEDIKMVGTGQVDLSEDIIERVKAIDQDVHLQVYVTPTCPYCPRAVIAAHKFAYLNPKIKSDMVEATEFPHLARKYNVMGVPRTIINETDFIEGAVPEDMLLDKIYENLNVVS